MISWDPDLGKMNWYFQYTPGDMWDYDEAGTHILIEGEVNGQARKLITHPARNGFIYAMERNNGQTLFAKAYMDNINWTKGIDQKTGKPLDYDPAKDIQVYSGNANPTAKDPTKKLCPSPAGGHNFWPASYSQKTKLFYFPVMTRVRRRDDGRVDSNKERGWRGGSYKIDRALWRATLTVADPFTGEVKKNIDMQYPNYCGVLSTAGGVVFTGLPDGTFAAFDDTRSSSSGRSTSASASARRR